MQAQTGMVLAVLLAGLGLFTLIVRRELIFKLLALNVASGGASLFLVAMARRAGPGVPILGLEPPPAADPLPQALVLTAIVIHFATLALALVYVIFLTEHRHSQDVRRLEKEEE
ncbi:MAG: Membrane-bound NADP+-reducing complex MBX, subunit MbxG (Na+/H+ transporter subunit) [Acetothermia bacterium 64_32]|nr:MAG: Membrane-bound NADP+-reducing complex MBX, subunit MbxG (Na+/H+ transporter subunit) [Acetothermia bacterium 64_32]MBC7098981.1 NADH-quinone oxidoreductase subunit K [Candidatus Bipolaricaulota bacterium]HAF71268.1 cation:proton antiporter [Candidatus Acetothermia bacterium]